MFRLHGTSNHPPLRSGEWGTSPWHWYATSALPRALMAALPLAGLGALMERRARAPLLVAAGFVALYSYLPHKEVRLWMGMAVDGGNGCGWEWKWLVVDLQPDGC